MEPESLEPWADDAVRRVRAELRATPLRRLAPASGGGVEVLLKDESVLPTGSLKYRHLRAMFCHAIADGRITAGTHVVAATGGAVAVAGAHFARLVGLPFTAVVPAKTGAGALERIERHGGRWRIGELPPAAIQQEAAALADRWGGHFLDHFTEAGPAMSAGGPTIADEMFSEVLGDGLDEALSSGFGSGFGEELADRIGDGSDEEFGDGFGDGFGSGFGEAFGDRFGEAFGDGLGEVTAPAWVVVGVGTGATSAAIGRYVRQHGLPTRLAVVDAENSAYFPAWVTGALDYGTGMPSRIPGIGRPRVEPGFQPDLIDLVIPVPDAASVAAMRWLRDKAGVDAGPATGANLWGVRHLANRMRKEGTTGTIVTINGDSGEAYRNTHLDPEWVRARGLDPEPFEGELAGWELGAD